MKRNKKIILLIGISLFFIFLGQINLGNCFSENSTGNYTRTEVLIELNKSVELINEMKENNFSVGYVNDTLTDALMILKQVDYAEILRGNVNATNIEKFNAQNALSLIDWEDLTYNDVINYTEEIQSRRDQAFEIYDSLTIIKIEIEKYKSQGINMNESINIFNQANDSFYGDRYGEAENLINQARQSIDTTVSGSSSAGQFKKYAVAVVEKDWYYILGILIIAGFAAYVLSRRVRKKKLEKKIKDMKAELDALSNLEKKAQTERFKENKISELTYRIRMKKYQERTNWIKEEIPVLESRLKKFKR